MITSVTIDSSNPTMTRTITYFTTLVIPDDGSGSSTITNNVPVVTNGQVAGASSPSETGLSMGAIVAIAVVAGLIFLAVVMYLYIRWRGSNSKSKRNKRSPQHVMDRFDFSHLNSPNNGRSRNAFQSAAAVAPTSRPEKNTYAVDSMYRESEFLPELENI